LTKPPLDEREKACPIARRRPGRSETRILERKGLTQYLANDKKCRRVDKKVVGKDISPRSAANRYSTKPQPQQRGEKGERNAS